MPTTNFPGGLSSAGVAVPKVVVSLTLKGTAAPGLSTECLTYDVSGGTVNVYAWKATNATTPTLIASTGTETVGYIITGS
jgi:hypothetical protein